MKNGTPYFGLLAVFTLFACAPARAQSGDHDEPETRESWEHRDEKRIAEIHKSLGLTPDQEARLKAHRSARREERKKFRAELDEKRNALRQELEKPDMDESRARAVHEDIKALHGRMADHRLNGILEVRKILTPEQFKKFGELMHERREKRWKRGRRLGRGADDRGGEKP